MFRQLVEDEEEKDAGAHAHTLNPSLLFITALLATGWAYSPREWLNKRLLWPCANTTVVSAGIYIPENDMNSCCPLIATAIEFHLSIAMELTGNGRIEFNQRRE